jgi:hypothetical protein
MCCCCAFRVHRGVSAQCRCVWRHPSDQLHHGPMCRRSGLLTSTHRLCVHGEACCVSTGLWQQPGREHAREGGGGELKRVFFSGNRPRTTTHRFCVHGEACCASMFSCGSSLVGSMSYSYAGAPRQIGSDSKGSTPLIRCHCIPAAPLLPATTATTPVCLFATSVIVSHPCCPPPRPRCHLHHRCATAATCS